MMSKTAKYDPCCPSQKYQQTLYVYLLPYPLIIILILNQFLN